VLRPRSSSRPVGRPLLSDPSRRRNSSSRASGRYCCKPVIACAEARSGSLFVTSTGKLAICNEPATGLFIVVDGRTLSIRVSATIRSFQRFREHLLNSNDVLQACGPGGACDAYRCAAVAVRMCSLYQRSTMCQRCRLPSRNRCPSETRHRFIAAAPCVAGVVGRDRRGLSIRVSTDDLSFRRSRRNPLNSNARIVCMWSRRARDAHRCAGERGHAGISSVNAAPRASAAAAIRSQRPSESMSPSHWRCSPLLALSVVVGNFVNSSEHG